MFARDGPNRERPSSNGRAHSPLVLDAVCKSPARGPAGASDPTGSAQQPLRRVALCRVTLTPARTALPIIIITHTHSRSLSCSTRRARHTLLHRARPEPSERASAAAFTHISQSALSLTRRVCAASTPSLSLSTGTAPPSCTPLPGFPPAGASASATHAASGGGSRRRHSSTGAHDQTSSTSATLTRNSPRHGAPRDRRAAHDQPAPAPPRPQHQQRR